jgi:hypothetical protein
MADDDLPSLEEMTQNSEHILIVEADGKTKKYYEVIYSKDTHHNKETETIYKEDVTGFKIIEVLKSATLKVGNNFWLWQKPAYDLYAIKMEHEQDMTESPIVEIYSSTYKINGEQRIVFLKNINKPKVPQTYNNFYHASEGLEAKQKIITFLKSGKIILPAGVTILKPEGHK